METEPNVYTLDAAEAAAIAQLKNEESRKVQLDEVLSKHQGTMEETFTNVIRKVFGAGDNDAAILIHRVPLICDEIRSINDKIETIDKRGEALAINFKWMNWLMVSVAGGVGSIVVTIIASIIVKLLAHQ